MHTCALHLGLRTFTPLCTSLHAVAFCVIQTRWPWILGCRCLICPRSCAPASTVGGIARNYDGGLVRPEVEINGDAHQRPNGETSVRGRHRKWGNRANHFHLSPSSMKEPQPLLEKFGYVMLLQCHYILIRM